MHWDQIAGNWKQIMGKVETEMGQVDWKRRDGICWEGRSARWRAPTKVRRLKTTIAERTRRISTRAHPRDRSQLLLQMPLAIVEH